MNCVIMLISQSLKNPHRHASVSPSHFRHNVSNLVPEPWLWVRDYCTNYQDRIIGFFIYLLIETVMFEGKSSLNCKSGCLVRRSAVPCAVRYHSTVLAVSIPRACATQIVLSSQQVT